MCVRLSQSLRRSPNPSLLLLVLHLKPPPQPLTLSAEGGCLAGTVGCALTFSEIQQHVGRGVRLLELVEDGRGTLGAVGPDPQGTMDPQGPLPRRGPEVGQRGGPHGFVAEAAICNNKSRESNFIDVQFSKTHHHVCRTIRRFVRLKC